ncbi:MAG: hypothetical protein ABIC82_05180 [bacterium]
MIKDAIDIYLQNPRWLSCDLVNITKQEGLLFPWLRDERVSLFFNNKYRLTSVVKLKEKDAAGTYYLQAVDLGCNGNIDILVIIDEEGRIIEDFIFKFEENRLSGDVAASCIHNREQRVINDLLQNLELPPIKKNMRLVLEMILDLQIDPFSKALPLFNLNLLKFLFDFGINDLKTNGKFDFKKVNFILERLKNPWSEAEARTILQMVNNYENIETIKSAEKVFERLGGVRNVSLIIYRGKYHGDLIAIVKNCDLGQKEMLEAVAKAKENL